MTVLFALASISFGSDLSDLKDSGMCGFLPLSDWDSGTSFGNNAYLVDENVRSLGIKWDYLLAFPGLDERVAGVGLMLKTDSKSRRRTNHVLAKLEDEMGRRPVTTDDGWIWLTGMRTDAGLFPIKTNGDGAALIVACD